MKKLNLVLFVLFTTNSLVFATRDWPAVASAAFVSLTIVAAASKTLKEEMPYNILYLNPECENGCEDGNEG